MCRIIYLPLGHKLKLLRKKVSSILKFELFLDWSRYWLNSLWLFPAGSISKTKLFKVEMREEILNVVIIIRKVDFRMYSHSKVRDYLIAIGEVLLHFLMMTTTLIGTASFNKHRHGLKHFPRSKLNMYYLRISFTSNLFMW
jgi:hypothetical protein